MVAMPFNHVIILPVLSVLNIKTLYSTMPIEGFLLPQSDPSSLIGYSSVQIQWLLFKSIRTNEESISFSSEFEFFIYIHDLCWVQALSLNPKFIHVSRFSTYKQCSEHTHPFIVTQPVRIRLGVFQLWGLTGRKFESLGCRQMGQGHGKWEMGQGHGKQIR